MKSKTSSSLLWIFSLVVLLNSCASMKGRDRYREGKNTQTKMSVHDEKKMAEEVLPQMQKDYPAYRDANVQDYINKLGEKIVKANNLEGNPYHYTFTVVDVGYVNAFALPAGTVFVSAPLIKMAENEAELAGVVGHEIGHVVSRHAAERMELMEKDKGKNLLYTAGGGILGGVAGYGLSKLLCKEGDTECMAKAVGGGAIVGAGGTLLVQKYNFMANSRENEMEADRVGFRYAIKAGYDKDLVGRFYEKLLQLEKSQSGSQNIVMKKFADAMSTHPPNQERIDQMHELAQSLPPQKSPRMTSHEFSEMKKRLK